MNRPDLWAAGLDVGVEDPFTFRVLTRRYSVLAVSTACCVGVLIGAGAWALGLAFGLLYAAAATVEEQLDWAKVITVDWSEFGCTHGRFAWRRCRSAGYAVGATTITFTNGGRWMFTDEYDPRAPFDPLPNGDELQQP